MQGYMDRINDGIYTLKKKNDENSEEKAETPAG